MGTAGGVCQCAEWSQVGGLLYLCIKENVVSYLVLRKGCAQARFESKESDAHVERLEQSREKLLAAFASFSCLQRG